MPKFKRSKLLSLLTIVVVGAGLTSCHSRSAEDKSAYVLKKVSSKLELQSSQEAKLESVAQSVLALRQEMRASKQDTLQEILTAIDSDNVTAEGLVSVYEQKKAILDQRVPGILTQIAAFHASLNDGQKKKVKDFANRAKDWAED
ncbi:MAG: Spy/CpxP family protein refolding chaperone [Pseudobacteriovorax sp.]|nr:Spy/CpxP family protein refolding chaperone [Pseudobacteriovorax sp.]